MVGLRMVGDEGVRGVGGEKHGLRDGLEARTGCMKLSSAGKTP